MRDRVLDGGIDTKRGCEGYEWLWMNVGHVTTLITFRVPFTATPFLKREEQRVRLNALVAESVTGID